ncbi:hypothetical protein ACQEVF_25315 [Nonomuraea polychroma]|uniref:hypothetical protein n=1 Tax=Nonomuraea polychroma TaxID=46176 RepID=UPI003D90D02A
MPKITRHGGASYAHAEPVDAASASVPSEAVVVVDPEPQIVTASSKDVAVTIGGEQPSAGNNSSTSAEKPETSPETSKPARRRAARTTANRSKRARAESSTADGTAGSGPETPDEGQDG